MVEAPGFKVTDAVTPADDNADVTKEIKLDRSEGLLKVAAVVTVGCSILGDV